MHAEVCRHTPPRPGTHIHIHVSSRMQTQSAMAPADSTGEPHACKPGAAYNHAEHALHDWLGAVVGRT